MSTLGKWLLLLGLLVLSAIGPIAAHPVSPGSPLTMQIPSVFHTAAKDCCVPPIRMLGFWTTGGDHPANILATDETLVWAIPLRQILAGVSPAPGQSVPSITFTKACGKAAAWTSSDLWNSGRHVFARQKIIEAGRHLFVVTYEFPVGEAASRAVMSALGRACLHGAVTDFSV